MPTKAAEKTCFVIMPFGDKVDKDGKTIHFNDVYDTFIEPTIKALDIDCIRCDKIVESGGIHNKMFTNIYDADVAVVDITMLNPNVFYELGMRHTIKKNVTIIIQQDDTKIPFNISGFTVVPYKMDDPVFQKQAADQIQTMIKNGMANVKKSDSPIYGVLPNLRVENPAQAIKKKQIYPFPLANVPDKQIGIITGDLQKVEEVDVWVNSENINMQMARPYDRSISAMIRFLGAKKDQTDAVEDDIIANELSKALGNKTSVAPGTVLYTSAGDLAVTNNVKRILHAASVIGQPGGGYSTIENISICVRNALAVLDDKRKLGVENLQSILFPLMGTGDAKRNSEDVAKDLVDEAIAYLEDNPDSNVKKVYFLAHNERDLELCERIMNNHDHLKQSAVGNG